MKNRQERRAEAKENGTAFVPQYKSSTGFNQFTKGEIVTLGGEPKTHEEAFGVGYERFNNKFITIKEVEETVEVETVTE